jgi:hypothetical protein
MSNRNSIIKKYKKPFILSKTKLIRMCEIVNKRFESAPDKQPYKISFIAKLQKGKEHKTSDIETLFNLDNSISNRITELTIDWEIGKEEDVNYTNITLSYDSDSYSSSSIFIGGKAINSTWLNETVAELEEQIDRTIPTGIIYKMKTMSPFDLLRLVSYGSLAMLMVFMVVLLSVRGSLKENALELDSQNKAILLEKYKAAKTTEGKIDFLSELMAKAILEPKPEVNLAHYIYQPRTYFLVTPLLLVVLIFLYLFVRCYPPYVFEWGDWEGYHSKLIERRKYLWSLLVGSLLIGIVSNLFVYGLSDSARPSK